MRANSNRTGALIFGELVDHYDAGRPRMDADFVARVAARGGFRIGSRLLEVGSGTGQLTGALLESNAESVVALEPSIPMADRLRDRYAGAISQGRLEVFTEPFESSAEILAGKFDQIWSADAWHWMDPASAYHVAANLLHPVGRLVAIWTFSVVDDPELASKLNDVYARLSPDLCRDPWAPLDGIPLQEGRDEVNASGEMRVTDHWIDRSSLVLNGPTYINWQLSFANIASLGAATRSELAAAIGRLVGPWGADLRVAVYRYVAVSEPTLVGTDA